MDVVVAVRVGHAGTTVERELSVVVDDDAPAAEVAGAIASAVGATAGADVRVVRTGAVIDGATRTGSLDLLQGDVLEVVPRPAPPPAPPAPPAAFELRIVGGPSAGARIPLATASVVIGRDPSADVALDDPELSRRHLHLGIAGDQIVLSDLGSTNGTVLEGAPVTGPTPLLPGQVIAAGRTLLTVAPTTAPGAPTARRGAGATLAFDRPPRVTRAPASATMQVPTPPVAPPKRKLPLSAAVVPVATGAVMSIFLGPVMLLFALMGPVMMAATLAEDRRSGRRGHATELKRFRADMASLDERVAAAHASLVRDRRAEAPDPAELLARVRSRSTAIWERRLRDKDALVARLGTAHLPSRLVLEERSSLDNGTPAPADVALVQRVKTAVSHDPDVPVDVDLRAIGVLGVAGDETERDALLRWLVLQTAVLHSPREVAIVALVPDRAADRWSWMHWLPHTETMVAGLPGARTVAHRPDEVRALFGALDDLLTARRTYTERRPGAKDDGWTPTVYVCIPDDVPVPRPALARVLADGPAYGIVVVVGAPRVEQLPGECRAIVGLGVGARGAEVTVTATGDTVHAVLPDGIPLDAAVDAARGLAPQRDVTASSASGELPRRVLLLDVIDMPEPTPDAVRARWALDDRRSGELGAPIGVGAAGTVSIDLRRDGPHALVAGTTGSGKSELLQSLVASLAATYPANVLTFVLIDYKGGAAFKDCVALPHTVGFFTDLDSHLAERALVSLNAELRRREEILREHGAKDLMDLERRRPDAAPANLLLVFDEFAFLKKEVPAFVAGVIDIAQRGRSLGVHLMLATQRPSGVVDDNIRANTNLRIALRIADETDSNDVIDRPDAARIPKSLPGRVFLRTGQDVQQVQTAYANARSSHGPVRIPTSVRPHELSCGLVERSGHGGGSADVDDHSPTDLQRLVEAIVAAHRAAGVPEQPHPWLDPLPAHVELGPLVRDPLEGTGELTATLGVVDLPDRQAQSPWAIDLGAAGHLLVYGTSGSGKTTVLRSLAVSLANRLAPTDLHLYALDFAGRGLLPLQALPHCGGVIPADEPERVERVVALLERIVDERRRVIGDAGAASLSEHRARGGRLPYVVLLLDGYGAFHSTYLNVDHGQLLDRVAQLVAQGRSVGVHLAITADRRGAVPTSLSSLVSSRVVLRMGDADEYASLGLPTALGTTKILPGRGFVDGGREVQFAVLGPDATGAGYGERITEWGRTLAQHVPATTSGLPVPVQGFSDLVPRAAVAGAAVPGSSAVPFGVSGTSDRVVCAALDDIGTFAVLGPDRSGRSNTLALVATGLAAQRPGIEAYLLAPRRTPLTSLGIWQRVAQGVDACDELARELAELARERQEHPGEPWLVVIDDGDELADSAGASSLSTLLRRGRDASLLCVAAVQIHTVHRSFGGWLTDLRKAKHAMLLMPDLDLDGELLGVRLPKQSSRRFPVGRGYLVRRGEVDYVQVALADA